MKHDPTTCPVCAPIITSAAYKRGRARALAQMATPATARAALAQQLRPAS